MKIALRHNLPATVRAMQRGLYNAVTVAAHQTADGFGTASQKAMRTALVQTGLGRMRGAVRTTSSLKERRNLQRIARQAGADPSQVPRLTLAGRNRAWSVVWNANSGDRSLGAFDAYSARDVTQIRPTGGRRWLAYPVGPFPRRDARRRKMTPALWKAGGFDSKIGPLVFIPGISPNVAYLAVRNVSVRAKTGASPRRLGKRGGVGRGRVKKDLIIAFVLIRGTTRNRRIDPVRIMEFQMGPALLRFGNLMSGFTRGNPVPLQPLFSSSGAASGVQIPVMRV